MTIKLPSLRVCCCSAPACRAWVTSCAAACRGSLTLVLTTRPDCKQSGRFHCGYIALAVLVRLAASLRPGDTMMLDKDDARLAAALVDTDSVCAMRKQKAHRPAA